MPIKQVICSICKQTVNKAVTYHVGGTDRACKSHEGVIEKKETLAIEKEKAQKMSVQKAEHRQASYTQTAWSQDYQTPKCWVCMNTGLRQQEFFMTILVEMKKIEKIHGLVNPFDPKYRVILKDRCIFLMPREKAEAAMKYVRDDFRQIVDMAGFISICGPCCRVANINPLPEPTVSDIEAGMVAYSFMEPVIEKIAGQEMVRDN
jgi:hypothetical protein